MLNKTETAIRVAFNTGELREAFKKIKHALSREETRYYLQGAFMHYDATAGGFYFVATDGHRLSRHFVRIDESQCETPLQVPAVILPREFMLDILKATGKRRHHPIDYYMTVSRDRLTYPDPEKKTLIEATPIDGTFPDYLRVIPKDEVFRPSVDRENLRLVCSAFAAACSAVDKTPVVKLTFEGKQLNIACSNDLFNLSAALDLADTVAIDASEATQFQIGFNAGHLADILAALDSAHVVLKCTDNRSPTIFAGEHDADTLHVCMPMRV